MADKVVVACKLPHGVVIPATDKTPEVTLAGAYTHRSFQMDRGIIAPIAYGTTEVDADVWEGVKKHYADWKPIKAGVIFAQAKAADLKAEAKEKAGLSTGIEQAPQPEGKDGVRAVDPATGKAK